MSFAGLDLRLATKVAAALEKELRNQERKARLGAAIALTKTAKRAEKAIYKQMASVFDRPTRYTMNALFVKPASAKSTAKELTASVKIKDAQLKNNAVPPVNYLIHQVEGGARQAKRFESALAKAGVMPAGFRAVPGKGAQLDQYGNMTGAQIVQILSYFRAFPELGYRANSTDKTRAKLKRGTKRKRGVSYFAAYPGARRTAHLRPGIYMKSYGALGASSPVPVLIFVRSVIYKPRLDFYGIARKTFDMHIDEELDNAIDFLRKPKAP